jgi:putative transposase
MSRFRKLSHTIWHCQYHIVWIPKYRFRMLLDRRLIVGLTLMLACY